MRDFIILSSIWMLQNGIPPVPWPSWARKKKGRVIA